MLGLASSKPVTRTGCEDGVVGARAQVGSRYNPRQSIVDNIHLPPSLISRFDLIYLVLDKADEASDRKLARHLLSLHYPDEQAQAQVATCPPHWRPNHPCSPFSQAPIVVLLKHGAGLLELDTPQRAASQ